MYIACIIPAREGSRGLEHKNIRLIQNKPLIAYTIEAAKQSQYKPRVIVSTDSKDYAKISLQYGAEIPFIRSKSLSGDNTHAVYAIIDLLEWLDDNEKILPDFVVMLQPTTPLRHSGHIDKAIDQYLKERPESMVGVTITHAPQYIRKIENGLLVPVYNSDENYQRQDFQDYYKPNGAIYISTPKYLLDKKTFYGGNVKPYYMAKEDSIDIDDASDLIVAEAILSKNYFDNLIKQTKTFASTKKLISSQFRNGIFNRLDIVVRYLALEELFGANTGGIKLYEKMQEKRSMYNRTHTYDPVTTDTKLLEFLAKDIEANGYNDNSSIITDHNLSLIDGSHRLACCLYFGIDIIPITIQPSNLPIDYSEIWFKNNGFTDEELTIINNKKRELFRLVGLYFTVILWPPLINNTEDIRRFFLERNCHIAFAKTLDFESIYEFSSFIKGIYSIDDVEEWKVEKKIALMKNYKHTIKLFGLDIDKPNFRTKEEGRSISQVVELLKTQIREKYKSKIKNYFHDVSIHIGDNYEHTDHIMQLSKKDIKINEFLKSIENYNYALTKVEVPYMPSDFPDNYPLGKDLDILCIKKDFNPICNEAKKFALPYKDRYLIKTFYKEGRMLIRFELQSAPQKKDFLCFQIDISEHPINKRVLKANYYTLEVKEELLIREKEYEKNPDKIYHLDFIKKYKI